MEVIRATLAGHDCCVIMRTGGGKSLCFQLPACMGKGVTLVISPLISLMEDQVRQLREVGVGAAMLVSSQGKLERKEVLERVVRALPAPSPRRSLVLNSCWPHLLPAAQTSPEGGEVSLLYVTPERVVQSNVLLGALERLHTAGRLDRIVIDEVGGDACCQAM